MRAFIAFLVFAAGMLFAADVKNVDVTGVGPTRDLAIKDGLRNAVEKAVGALVTSETVVDNSMLIKDKILSYSAGYVEDYKVTSEALTMGQATVNLSVQVASLKLRQKLDSLNIAVAKLPGQAFSVQIDTKRKAETDAASMLVGVLNKYPKAAYKVAIKPPKLLKDRGEVADVQVDMAITVDMEWLQAYESMVAAVANQKLSAPSPEQLIRNGQKSGGGQLVIAGSPFSTNSLDFGLPKVGYVVGDKPYEMAASRLGRPQQLVMQFYSADREIIYSTTLDFGLVTKMMQGRDGVTDHPACVLGACVGGAMGAWIYKDFTQNGSTTISVPVEVLRKIASVECFFDPGDQLEGGAAESPAPEVFGGVGARLRNGAPGEVFVASTLPDGPADRSGIKAGYRIMSVNGIRVGSSDEAIPLLRGKPGTEVDVCYVRPGEDPSEGGRCIGFARDEIRNR